MNQTLEWRFQSSVVNQMSISFPKLGSVIWFILLELIHHNLLVSSACRGLGFLCLLCVSSNASSLCCVLYGLDLPGLSGISSSPVAKDLMLMSCLSNTSIDLEVLSGT